MNFFSLLLFFGLALTLPVSAQTQPREAALQTVIGSGIIHGEAHAAARDEAIANGLVSALERAVSRIIPADALVRHFRTIHDLLYNQTGKYVREYKVLGEIRTEKSYRVIVQAAIAIEMLESELARLGITRTRKDLPRVLFLIAEQSFNEVLPQYWWGEELVFVTPVTETAMAGAMREKGFTPIERREIRTENPIDKPYLEDQEVLQLASGFPAEVVVAGNASVRKAPNVTAAGLRSFEAEVAARALRKDTGEVIASVTRTAVRTNAEEAAGAREALAAAGLSAGQELSAIITSAWYREEKKERTVIEMVVGGTSRLADFVAFRKALEGVSGVSAIRTREMAADSAVLSVDFLGSPRNLADALMLKTFDSFGMRISEVSESRLKVDLVSN